MQWSIDIINSVDKTKFFYNLFSFLWILAGHSWEELYPCIQWMKCFADVTLEKGVVTLKSFEHVTREDAHNIQTHAVELALLVSYSLILIEA